MEVNFKVSDGLKMRSIAITNNTVFVDGKEDKFITNIFHKMQGY